jgi:hypothetical protein
MKRHRIIPIVEGYGEQVAIPRLLSRWFKFRRFTNFDTPDLAIRAPGANALKCPHDDAEALGIEYYVGLAARQAPAGILVVLDADDECIERTRLKARKGLGPELLERARRIAPHIPIEVVVADREYEAWFLAASHELARAGMVRGGAHVDVDEEIERVRDCKGRMARWLGRPYEPSTDQVLLTDALPFSIAITSRSRSYRKLLKALDALSQAARRKK